MREPTRQRSGQTMDVEPIGSAGLDLNTNPALMGPDKLRDARNVSLVDDALARRKASAKVTHFADATASTGSKRLGVSSTKYAHFTPPLFPKGGCWWKFALETIRPGAGSVTYVSSWTSAAKTHRVLGIELASTGVITTVVEWEGGSSTTLTCATANATNYTGLLVYDSVAGTLTLYLDGAQAAQATGLASTLQPRQDAGVVWYLGLSFTPGTGPDANTGTSAAMGPFIGGAFRGKDITAGANADPLADTSLLMELRMGTFQDWPNPASRMILFHYAMREASGFASVPMVDASKFKNNGAYVGTPSTAAQLVWPAQNGNVVLNVRKATIGALGDGAVNIIGVGGSAYYEILEGAN